jgi:hypothetical protein
MIDDFQALRMGGLEVLARPWLCRTSRDIIYVAPRRPLGAPTLIVFSVSALRLLLGQVMWHDEPDHCRTWSEGCRCDLGDEA